LFPSEGYLFNSEALKGKLTRILRAAIRKLEARAEALKAEGGPTLVRLQDSKQRLIVNSENARQLRLLLLRLHEEDLNFS
jgi:hypothetical protein